MAGAQAMTHSFEKAVADKMGKGRANKQGTPSKFPDLGHKNAGAGGVASAKKPAPFKLHPMNKKKVSVKRGMTH